MNKLLRKFRSNFLINRLFASIIKIFGFKVLYPKWPVKGDISFNISGQNVIFHSKCDDHLVSRYYYSGFDEEILEIETLSEIVNPNGVFFDIGSYNGLFSMILGKKFPNAEIFAFEPNPSNFERLTYNIKINKLTNIKSLNVGVSDKNGKLEIFCPEDLSLTTVSSFSDSFFYNHSNTKAIKKEIDVIRIDTFCTNKSIIPDFIKIDVEGHELEVFESSFKIIKKYKPIILCEIFSRKFESNEEFEVQLPNVYKINAMLISLGYKIFVLNEKKWYQIDSLNYNSSGRNFLFLANDEDTILHHNTHI